MAAHNFTSVWLLFTLFAVGGAAEDKPWKTGEISLYAGYGHSRARGSSSYHQGWISDAFPIAGAETSLSASSRDAIYVGAFFSIFFAKSVGLQTGFGYLKTDVPGQAVFDLGFPTESAAKRETWKGTGEVTAIPLCLNIAGRFGDGKFRMSISTGLAWFLNSFFADSYAGTAAVSTLPQGGFDAFRIPVAVKDKTWNALGGNFGWSGDISLSENLALTAEARYFFCPIKTFDWEWIPGTYTGLLGNVPSWNFNQTSAAEAGARTSPLRINPSFFTVSVGVKFLK